MAVGTGGASTSLIRQNGEFKCSRRNRGTGIELRRQFFVFGFRSVAGGGADGGGATICVAGGGSFSAGSAAAQRLVSTEILCRMSFSAASRLAILRTICSWPTANQRRIDAINIPNRGWIPNLPDQMQLGLYPSVPGTKSGRSALNVRRERRVRYVDFVSRCQFGRGNRLQCDSHDDPPKTSDPSQSGSTPASSELRTDAPHHPPPSTGQGQSGPR